MIPGFAVLLSFLAAQTGAEAKQTWLKGPTVPRRRGPTAPLATYLGWLREVESSPALAGESALKTVQRMRRLYYSKFSAEPKTSTGKLADEAIDVVFPTDDPPLTTDHVPQATLDGLFQTGTIQASRQLTVDIGHLWMVADALMNGVAFKARAYLDSEPSALFSWSGDLGSALRNFRDHESVRMSHTVPTAADKKAVLLQAVAGFAGKEDLLGDMDAVILGRRWESLGSGFVLSKEIEDYYRDDARTQLQATGLLHPNSARRFHHFLNVVEPAIPITGRDSVPLQVALKQPEATEEIKKALIAAIADTWKKPISEIDRKLDDRGRSEFDALVGKFVEFLDVGLRDGDAPWPPNSL